MSSNQRLREACESLFGGSVTPLADDDDCQVTAGAERKRVLEFLDSAESSELEAQIAEFQSQYLGHDDGDQFWDDEHVLSGYIGILLDLACVHRHVEGLGSGSSLSDLQVEEGDVKILRGDVRVRGDCRIAGTVVVLGDLDVGGSVFCYGNDWWSGTVIVLGAASMQCLIAMGPGVVGEGLYCRAGIYAEYFHDAPSSFVAGALHCPVLVEAGEHYGMRSTTVEIEQLVDLCALESEARAALLPSHYGTDGRRFQLRDLGPRFFRDVAATAAG